MAKVLLLLKKIKSLNNDEKYQEVIELLNEELIDKLNNADLYSQKALAYYRIESYNSCEVLVNKALTIDPNNSIANNYYGNLYNSKNLIEKAIEFYNISIKNDSYYSSPYNGLGNAYIKLKQYDKAKEAFEKAISLDPRSSNPYNGLGIVYNKLQDFDNAIKYFNKAIEIDPESSSPYYNRASLYLDKDSHKKALIDFEIYINKSEKKDDYFYKNSKLKIIELKKIIKSHLYSNINELVNKIKSLLLFKDNCITHYTSLSAAKALIIKSSLLRLSEGAFLNDTSEGRELFKFLSFHYSSQNGNDTIAEAFTQKPFIGSFVAEVKHDDLTLWRMYGKEEKEEARGCAITIEVEKLLNNLNYKLSNNLDEENETTTSKVNQELNFYRVAYRKQGGKDEFLIPNSKKEDQALLNEYMADLLSKVNTFKSKKRKSKEEIQNVTNLLNEIAYLFKSDEYQFENEVRLVIKGIGFERIINEDFLPPRVYIELISIRPLIKKITLGPKVDRADEWAAAFYYNLEKDEFYPEILISHLPFK